MNIYNQPAWPFLLFAGIAGVSVWALFLQYTANQERLASSLMQQIMTSLKDNEEVRNVLGEAVRFEPAWYLNGDPWVSGQVRCALLYHCRGSDSFRFQVGMIKGSNDLSFRVKGHKGVFLWSLQARSLNVRCLGAGTVYFTSIRKAKGEPFTTRTSRGFSGVSSC